MSSKTDPTLLIALIVIGTVLGLTALLFAVIVVIPVALLTIGGILIYRYYWLQKFKSRQRAPVTIKDRPNYVEPSVLAQSIKQDRWLLNRFEEDTGKYSCQPLADAFAYVVATLYAEESFHAPPLKPETADQITLGRYYRELGDWQRKVSDENNFELFMELLGACYMALREHFPPYALVDSPAAAEGFLTTPLRILDEEDACSSLISAFFDADFKRRRLFEGMRSQIERNDEAGGDNTLQRYFAGTPFRVFSKLHIPVALPDETRFAGMWCIAPQGMGKTTLLHNLITEDLKKDACIILIDSKGDLIEPFLRHPALASRRVIIGPDHPVGMNPLDVPRTDLNRTVENLEYLFSSLLDFKLTAVQSMLLKAVLRTLVTAFPNPTLETFQEIMGPEGPKKYANYINKLEPDLRNFFIYEFFTENIKARRQEVLQRLRLLLDHDLLRSMLLASSTTFDMGDAMDRGAFIIINNSRARLGNKGAEFFGRFFIAQVLAAAQQRSFRKASEKKPVYFYIDECHTVIAHDERITDVLHECRSQKIALTLAHQETTQVSEKVLSALENCAIRFARPDEEARSLASTLRMDVKTLQSLRLGQFAAYIRGFAQEGIVVNVARPEMSALPASKISYIPPPPKPAEATIDTRPPETPTAEENDAAVVEPDIAQTMPVQAHTARQRKAKNSPRATPGNESSAEPPGTPNSLQPPPSDDPGEPSATW